VLSSGESRFPVDIFQKYFKRSAPGLPSKLSTQVFDGFTGSKFDVKQSLNSLGIVKKLMLNNGAFNTVQKVVYQNFILHVVFFRNKREV